MLKFSDIEWKNPGLFAAGVLFGTAGIKVLSSKDAKESLHWLQPQLFSEQKSVS